MKFWYTARGIYDKYYDQDGMSWKKYIEWSKLSQLKEVVSLDMMLNELLVEPDRNKRGCWKIIQTNTMQIAMSLRFGDIKQWAESLRIYNTI